MELQLSSQSTTGHGVARGADGEIVLVQGAVLGERVRVQIERRRGSRLGVLQQLLEPIAERRAPPCPYAQACGGCDLMFITDEHQPQLHRQALVELLARRLPSVQLPEVAMHVLPPLRYRQRARLAAVATAAGVRLGYRRERGRDVVAIDDCLVLEAPLVEALEPLRALLAGSRGRGEVAIALGAGRRAVVELHWQGTLAVEAFAQADRLIGERVWAGARLWQQGARTPAAFGDARPSFEGSDGQPVLIAAGGFAQPSARAGRLLAGIVRRLVGAVPGHLVELFAGSGTLTVALAGAAAKLTVVEQDEAALAQLRENIARRTIALTAKRADANEYPIPRSCHTLVLDPPRAGAPGAMQHAIAARVRQIVYVSCDPITLARDLRPLSEAGYRLTDIELIAMFPQTHHFETVVRLAK